MVDNLDILDKNSISLCRNGDLQLILDMSCFIQPFLDNSLYVKESLPMILTLLI